MNGRTRPKCAVHNNAVQSCPVCPRPNCNPSRCRKVSPRIRKHQTSGKRDLLLSPTLKLDPLFARVRQLGLATLKAKIVPMQHMTHTWGDPYSMFFQKAQLELCPREWMLYGAHGSTDRLNTSNETNTVNHSPLFSLFQSSPRHALHLGFPACGCTGGSAVLSMICQSVSNRGTLMQRSEATPTHISSPRFTPQPPVSVFFVSICFGRGQLDVRKPHRWAGLGSPILVGDERDASAVLCVVCFKSRYDVLPRNLQGKSTTQQNRRKNDCFLE